MRRLTQGMAAAMILSTGVAAVEYGGLRPLGLTHAQEISAAILLIAAVLWISEWVPLFVVSFLILALEIVWLLPELHIHGLAHSSSVFFSAFFSNIILLFLGGFVLSSLMQKYGLDLKFARAILRRTHGNANITLLGIIIASAFLSMWMSNTATAAMMLTVVLPLMLRIPEGHPFRIALVLSIPFACNIGGIATPIGTPPNAIALSFLNTQGIALSFAQWMGLSLPFVAVMLLFLWQLLVRLYPAKGLLLQLDTGSEKRFDTHQALALAIFIITATAWLFGGNIGLATGTVALFPLISCFWFGLLDTADFRSLPWDILYVIAGGLALGAAVDHSGLGRVLLAVMPEDAELMIIIGAITAALMSTLMSNTATAGLLIPLVLSLDASSHDLRSVVISIAISCSLAMALPVTTPPNAIAFSSRAIHSRDMFFAGGIMTLVGVATLLLFARYFWQLA